MSFQIERVHIGKTDGTNEVFEGVTSFALDENRMLIVTKPMEATILYREHIKYITIIEKNNRRTEWPS